MRIQALLTKKALVFVWFQVQYDQYCPSFSYFTDLLQQNMRNQERYQKRTEYLLSANSSFIK